MNSNLAQTLRILHFNDVYELEDETAKMVEGLRAQRQEGPSITVFSGDVFSPTAISNQMKGQNMVPILLQCEIDYGTFGNHDFDHGLTQLSHLCRQLPFPWVMSNLLDSRRGTPVANAAPHLVVTHNDLKVGFMGLAEQDWFSILHIDTTKLTYHDFVQVAHQKVALFQEQKCDLVIAITHMRSHNDILLAQQVPGIHLILGGHDHVIMDETVNNCRIIKSGTNFQQFGVIDVTLDLSIRNTSRARAISIKNTCVSSASLGNTCPVTQDYVNGIKQKYEQEYTVPIAYLSADLDTRFAYVRAQESAIGNLLADLCRLKLKADAAILNGGCLRTDSVIPQGFVSQLTMNKILAIQDLLVVKRLSGEQLLECLENSVSKYPSLDGRWPLLSHLSLSFDPSLPPGQRILSSALHGQPILPTRLYNVVMKHFQAQGYDGYDAARDAAYVLAPEADIQMQSVPIHFFSHPKEKSRLQSKGSPKALQLLSLMEEHNISTDQFEIEGETRVLYRFSPVTNGRITIL